MSPILGKKQQTNSSRGASYNTHDQYSSKLGLSKTRTAWDTATQRGREAAWESVSWGEPGAEAAGKDQGHLPARLLRTAPRQARRRQTGQAEAGGGARATRARAGAKVNPEARRGGTGLRAHGGRCSRQRSSSDAVAAERGYLGIGGAGLPCAPHSTAKIREDVSGKY